MTQKIFTDTGQGLCAFDMPCTVNRNVNDLVLDPQDPSGNTLIVWLNGVNIAGDGGIYRSTNAMSGSPTFTQTLVTTSTSTSNGRGELRAYVRGGTTVVYVASGEPVGGGTLCTATSQSGALRRSTDGGVTWSGKLPGGGGFCGGQCFYNIGFDVLPGAGTSTDKLLLGGNVSNMIVPGNIPCARQEATSLDGAATSFTGHDSITHADTHAIKFAPSNSNIAYRGDDGGIWKSTDGGNTWAPLNNTTFRATQFQSLALHPTDPDFTLGGTQDNGTDRLTTGSTWFHSDDGDGGFTEIDQNAVNTTTVTMYHTYFNQAGTQIGYARALNGNQGPVWGFLGCTGVGTNRGITCTNPVNFYAPMAIGPGTPNTVYLGTDRLYRSADAGLSNQIVSQAPLVAGVPLSAIGIAKNDDNYRIVGLNNGALFFTTTGSSTLTNLDPTGAGSTIPDFYVGRLVFDPNNKNTVYISLNGFSGGTAPSQSHVWKVTNLNTTPVKTPINGSGTNTLPDVPVNAFAVDTNDPSHAGISVLYAGTDIGVYQSIDGGANWVPFGIGLPRVAVFDMGIPNTKRVLRIATHGRGMWEIEIPNCMMTKPSDITVGNDLGQCGANVSFSDPTFTGSCGTITCSPASGSFFALGTTTVTCTSQANTSTSFTVTVNDTEPPTVTPISVAIPTLGYLNHDMFNVGLSGGSFSDNCPGATRQILVFGNENDETDTGDGNFSPDALNIGIGTLRLRGERIGGGSGRVYLIIVKVTDAAGNVSVTVATVVVPKSSNKSDVDAVNALAAAARTYALSHSGAPPPGYFVIGDGPVIGPKQ